YEASSASSGLASRWSERGCVRSSRSLSSTSRSTSASSSSSAKTQVFGSGHLHEHLAAVEAANEEADLELHAGEGSPARSIAGIVVGDVVTARASGRMKRPNVAAYRLPGRLIDAHGHVGHAPHRAHALVTAPAHES